MRYLIVLLVSCSASIGAEPQRSVLYADVLAMVKAGGELKVAFGVDAPKGYLRVDDAPFVAEGLYKCWREDDGKPKMKKEDQPTKPVSVAEPRPILPYPVLPNVQALIGRPICVGPV